MQHTVVLNTPPRHTPTDYTPDGAVAGNGERVITNLFAALQPILEAGARQCADAKATLAVQQAQAARAARGVQV